MSEEEKKWVIASHIGTLLGYFVVVGQFAVPLVIWLLKHEESDEIADHARASLNFQLTMLACTFAAYLLTFVLIGVPILIGLGIFNLVCVILATIKANDGELFNYPLSYPFFK